MSLSFNEEAETREAEKCPQCGRFVGDAYGKPGDAEYSPGYADRGTHVEGCEDDEYAEDFAYVEVFCDKRCADQFHHRRPR